MSTGNGNIKTFKINIFQGTIYILGFILIIRLFYLQIFQYKSYIQRAQYATSKISILTSPRGIIYDRNGNVLATNKQSISLIAYPNKLKTKEERLYVFNILSKILNTNSEKLKQNILKLPENAPLPIRLINNLSIKESISIVEKKHLLPGITIQEEPSRFYPNNSLASHVLGYISQIDEEELVKRPDRKLGDLVGREGVEQLFDDILRGKDGKKIVEVDRFGNPIDPKYKHAIINIKPVPGKNIVLTLDINLQKAAEKALEETMSTGTVIAADPNTGEVLALANYPNYDPNIFTKPISETKWKELLSKNVFLNRALLAYVPGSIWKPITLITALESMVVKPTERFNVSEAIYLGNTRFGDWTDKKGLFTLQEALAWSRDTAFYQIGQRLTPEQIKNWGVKFTAGKKTGIELLGEEKGIVPDKEWKKKNIGEPWYPGNTLHYAIGQGFVLLTPTQAARIYSGIANGGKIPKLQLIKKINKYVKPYQQAENFKLDPKILNVVREGLELCIEKGTGSALKTEGIKIAGKTGSAEVFGTNKTHGWFAAYAPTDNPKIVVVALLEKGGHGGTVAAPVVKKILEEYFKDRIVTQCNGLASI